MSVVRNLFRIGAGAFVIILIIQLGANTTSEPPFVITGQEWNIETGDSLIFEINVTSERSSDLENVQAYWAHLNNTRIAVNVISLPTMLHFYTVADYLAYVVMAPKISCRFENGTYLSEPDLFIESLVSYALLPVGSWEYLEQLFSDQEYDAYQMYVSDYIWVASIDDGELLFGNLGYSWHGTRGWSARVNITSGVPLMIETHDTYHDNGFTSDILQLTLVSYVSG